MDKPQSSIAQLRETWRHIIFGTDTPAGRFFDQSLIIMILLSVLLVMVDSVPAYRMSFGDILYRLEWGFTIIFTIEYFVRVWVSSSPRRYIFSFYGFVDILSILPTYLSLFITGANYLLIIRLLRVLRVFRVLKLMEYMGEARILMTALQKARRKIVVFMYGVTVLAVIFGSLMYMIEGAASGFTSIPKSIYWAIVTITTVGYGDISPATPFGQALASFAMLTGYAIIAIPTGIVTAEIAMLSREIDQRYGKECSNCHKHQHSPGARFCDNCGTELPEQETVKPQ
jgi:voltage-gated potassium channel